MNAINVHCVIHTIAIEQMWVWFINIVLLIIVLCIGKLKSVFCLNL